MSVSEIGKAIENIENDLQSQADPGPRPDVAATATIEDGLKCRIESPDGTSHLYRHADQCRWQRHGKLTRLASARGAGELRRYPCLPCVPHASA